MFRFKKPERWNTINKSHSCASADLSTQYVLLKWQSELPHNPCTQVQIGYFHHITAQITIYFCPRLNTNSGEIFPFFFPFLLSLIAGLDIIKQHRTGQYLDFCSIFCVWSFWLHSLWCLENNFSSCCLYSRAKKKICNSFGVLRIGMDMLGQEMHTCHYN